MHYVSDVESFMADHCLQDKGSQSNSSLNISFALATINCSYVPEHTKGLCSFLSLECYMFLEVFLRAIITQLVQLSG